MANPNDIEFIAAKQAAAAKRLGKPIPTTEPKPYKDVFEIYEEFKTASAQIAAERPDFAAQVKQAQAAKVEATKAQEEAAKTLTSTAIDVGGTIVSGKLFPTSPTTAKWGGDGTSASPLTLDGKVYTGVKDGVQYSNGIAATKKPTGEPVDTWTGDGTVGSPLIKNGNLFTGYYAGSQYVNGVLQKTVSFGGTITAPKTLEENPAFVAASKALEALGVTGVAEAMAQIRTLYPNISSEDALMLLKFDSRFNKAYLNRFWGNKLRLDAGLAPLSDADYLRNEEAYGKTFTAYGLDMFKSRSKYAELIAANKDPEEVATLVSLAVDRVLKGAPEVTKAIKQLYPELTNADLVAYVLDPKTQLPAFKRKVQAAEIGGAALFQGLSIGGMGTKEETPFTNVKRESLGIFELEQRGLTQAEAQLGYGKVAMELPTAEKLSSIYSGYEQYGRIESEQANLLGLASARRKQEAIKGREIAEFSGTSGANRYSEQYGSAGMI